VRRAVHNLVRKLASYIVSNDADGAHDANDADDAVALNLAQSGWYNGRTRELAPGFKIAAADTVVDVGCGAGNTSTFAARQGAEVISLDIDASAIEGLKRNMSEARPRSFQALVSDCNPIPLPRECGTVVLAMEVLEHVDDPAAFLAELVRIGKPDARYLISVPDSLSESIQRTTAPPTYWSKPNHIRVFERDQFRSAVELAGLSVERHFFYGFYSSMWWSLYWAVPPNRIPYGKSGDSDLLKNWNRTWKALLATPHSRHIWEALENALPKSQAIVARKAA
jgi:SAM-dependent methyltransferase